MKVSQCTTADGTFVTFVDAGFETTVRLPNGANSVVADLLRLASEEEVRAAAATKRAQRLRKAAQAHGIQGAGK